jgi:hypothetical protein
MGKAIEYKFAEINSEHEIVVHLGNLESEMTLGELADLFGVTQTEILFALNLPLNASAGRLLYRAVREKMALGNDPDAPELPPDETIPRPVNITNLLLATAQHWGEGESWTWEMPKQDIYLPLYDALVDQLTILYARRTKTDRKYVVGRADTVRVEDYELAVTRLENAMAARAAKLWTGYAELFAAVGLIRAAVTMQQQHWTAEAESGGITEESFAKKSASVEKLSVAVAALEEKAAQTFDDAAYAEERAAAKALLDMFTVDEAGTNLPLQTLIEAAYTQRRTVAPAQLSRIHSATIRACQALAQSCEVERFTREHAVDILQEAGANLTKEAKFLLTRDGGALGAEVIREWEATILALRRGLHCEEASTSVLRHIQRGIRTYRLGLSGVSALLEQGVVAQVMVGLHRGLGQGSTVTKVTRGMSRLILRSLANNAVKHRAADGEIFLASGDRLSEILKKINRFDTEYSEILASKGPKDLGKFWLDRGDELKNLQVRPVPRSAGGATIRTGVSFLAFLVMLQPVAEHGADEERDANYWAAIFGLIGGSLNLGEHALRRLEFTFKGAPFTILWGTGEAGLKKFDKWMKFMSGAASIAGAVGNACRIGADGRFDSKDAFEVAALGVNATIGICQVLLGAKVWLRGAALWNAWAGAVGIALFIAQIVYEHYNNVGVRPTLKSLIDATEKLRRAGGIAKELQKVRSIVEDDDTALSVLADVPGGPSDPTPRPTYWTAARAGFPRESIEAMFGATPASVRTYVGAFFTDDRERSET